MYFAGNRKTPEILKISLKICGKYYTNINLSKRSNIDNLNSIYIFINSYFVRFFHINYLIVNKITMIKQWPKI